MIVAQQGEVEAPNLIRTLGEALYTAAETLTGMVGLTPLQVVAVAGALFALLVLWQVVQAARGKSSFTLEDEA